MLVPTSLLLMCTIGWHSLAHTPRQRNKKKKREQERKKERARRKREQARKKRDNKKREECVVCVRLDATTNLILSEKMKREIGRDFSVCLSLHLFHVPSSSCSFSCSSSILRLIYLPLTSFCFFFPHLPLSSMYGGCLDTRPNAHALYLVGGSYTWTVNTVSKYTYRTHAFLTDAHTQHAHTTNTTCTYTHEHMHMRIHTDTPPHLHTNTHPHLSHRLYNLSVRTLSKHYDIDTTVHIGTLKLKVSLTHNFWPHRLFDSSRLR